MTKLAIRPDMPAGIHDYQNPVSIAPGKALQDGDIIGRLVLLRFAPEISLPREVLRGIYLSAGLSEDDVPKARSASDAWRVATASLKDKEIVTRGILKVKILVRDWERGRSPRRDLTLEHQDYTTEKFKYTSPAAKLFFDPEKAEMTVDMGLDKNNPREAEAYAILKNMIEEVRQQFKELQGLVEGDYIQRSVKKIVERTAPVPIERAAWMIWVEHDNVVHAVNGVIAALNDYNKEPEKKSAIHIFTVVNTPQERQTITSAIEQTVQKEVEASLTRMGNALKEPEKLFESQAKVERDLYERLLKMVEEYELKFRQDRNKVKAYLDQIDEMQSKMMAAISENRKQKRLKEERAKWGLDGGE